MPEPVVAWEETEDLTAEHFARQGWAVISGAIPQDRLVHLRLAFDALMSGGRDARVWQMPEPHKRYDGFLRHFDADLTRVLCRLSGARRLKVLQDVLICKPPGAPEVAWHTDHSYTGFVTSGRVVSVRLALTDEGRDEGCLAVAAGSHLWPAEPSRSHRTLLSGPEATVTARRDPERKLHGVDVPLRAGDISVHHCRTWHRSHPNATENRVRKTVVVHVFDADSAIDPRLIPTALRSYVAHGHFIALPWSA